MKIAFVNDYGTPPYRSTDSRSTTAHEPIPRVGEMVQDGEQFFRVLKVVYNYDLDTAFVYVRREIPQ